MINKIFKILPLLIILAIVIAGLDVIINNDYTNKLLTEFLNLDNNLLYTSASLIIYAILSNNQKYEKIAKMGIILCTITLILPFISTIIDINNLNTTLYDIIRKITNILNILESCIKYSAILLLIDTTNQEANKYKSFAIKTQIAIFIYQTIFILIELDYEWILRISNSYTVLNGFFYLFTIMFLIERAKDIAPQLHLGTNQSQINQNLQNIQQNINSKNLFTSNIQTNLNQENLFTSNIQIKQSPENQINPSIINHENKFITPNYQLNNVQENQFITPSPQTNNIQENQFITPNPQANNIQENQFIIPNIQPIMEPKENNNNN